MKTKHIIIGIIAVVAIYFLFFRGKKKMTEEQVIAKHKEEFEEISTDPALYKKCDWMAEEGTGRSFCEIDGKKVYYDEIKGGKK